MTTKPKPPFDTLPELPKVTSTQAKNSIGDLKRLARSGPVSVTSRGVVEFVVISPEEYRRLRSASAPENRLAEMSREFDALFSTISNVDAEDVMTSVSAATDEELQEALREFRERESYEPR